MGAQSSLVHVACCMVVLALFLHVHTYFEVVFSVEKRNSYVLDIKIHLCFRVQEL